jgi:hypothetical protein
VKASTYIFDRARPGLESLRFVVCALPLLVALVASGDESPRPVTESPNGFDLSKRVVPLESIRSGGPARDAIRSVDTPEFVRPAEAVWAPPPVAAIGVASAGEARAYPIHLMEYHQIVNDTIGGVPVVVTYDPLTGVPMAFERSVAGKLLHFGVSGLIHRAQFLLYDRETESLWAQYEGRAIAGPLAGSKLERIPIRQEPIGAWLQRHPETTVLARPDRMGIDYRYSPFQAYWVSEVVPVEVDARDDRYHPKEVALGVERNGKTRVYLGSILTAEGGRIVDEFEGRRIRVAYDSKSGTFLWEAPDDVRVTDAYWFAWKSFNPDTEIWQGKDPGDSSKPSAPRSAE